MMETESEYPRRRTNRTHFRTFRYVLLCTAIWVIATCIASVVHVTLWTPTTVPGIPTEAAPLKPVANGVHMVTLPGWVVTFALLGREHHYTLPGAFLAHGVTLGGLFIGWCVLNALRRFMLRLCASGGQPTEVNAQRRRFVVNAATGAVAATPAVALLHTTAVAPWQLAVRRYRVPIRGLPASLDGLRAVQVSDTHLGPRVSAAFLSDVIQRAVDLKPDIFLLTGDYVHNGTHHIDHAVELMRPLVDAAAIGVVGTLGNHDWYADGPRISRQLTDIGVRMIDNNRVFLDADLRQFSSRAPASGICIAGIGDLLTDVVDIATALRDTRSDLPCVLLSHNPDCAEIADLRGRIGRLRDDAPGSAPSSLPDPPRIDLMLSGHTHGGQISLPFLGPLHVPSAYGNKYAGGLVNGPSFPVVISRGVGLSLLPVRLRVPPELVEITFVSA